MRIHVFWDVMLCHWLGGYKCFEGIAVAENTDIHPPSDTPSQPKRLESSGLVYFYVIHRKLKE
jgi:hypothetical protein